MNTSATVKMIDRPCHSYKHVKKISLCKLSLHYISYSSLTFETYKVNINLTIPNSLEMAS